MALLPPAERYLAVLGGCKAGHTALGFNGRQWCSTVAVTTNSIGASTLRFRRHDGIVFAV